MKKEIEDKFKLSKETELREETIKMPELESKETHSKPKETSNKTNVETKNTSQGVERSERSSSAVSRQQAPQDGVDTPNENPPLDEELPMNENIRGPEREESAQDLNREIQQNSSNSGASMNQPSQENFQPGEGNVIIPPVDPNSVNPEGTNPNLDNTERTENLNPDERQVNSEVNPQQKSRENKDNQSKEVNPQSGSSVDNNSRNTVDDLKKSNTKSEKAEKGATGDNTNSSNDSKLASMGDSIKNKLGQKAAESSETVDKAKKTVDKVQKTAAMTGKIASGGLALITNPVSWIVILLLLLAGIMLSGTQLLGRSDFAKNCSPSGNVEIGGATLTGDDKERANSFGTWLTTTKFKALGDKPFTKEDAAAIVGNAHHESHVSSTAMEGEYEYGDKATKYKTYDNEKVLSTYGSSYNHALGLVQWDGSRRVKLVEFAKSKGKQWHDINIQLEFLKGELDEGYAGVVKQLSAASGVEAKTEVWRTKFEVGAQSPGRLSFAKEFMTFFKGGGQSIGSGESGDVASCTGDDGGSVDTSEIIKLALEISYSTAEYSKSNVTCPSGLNGCGKSASKPGYIKAKEIAEKNGGKDPLGDLFASCDRLVATLLKATKKDVDFPWGSTTQQASYLASSSKWTRISCSARKPGDVLIVPDKHVMLYVGKVAGADSLASASYTDRTAAIGPLQGCSGDLFHADGYPNAIGYRLK